MRIKQWSQTLRWRLIWPSIAINLVAVAVTAWIASYLLRQSLNRRLVARAEVVSDAVSYAAESVIRIESLQRFVASIGSERDVKLLVVVESNPPRVQACTDQRFNGAPLERIPWPEAIPALKKALREGQSTIQIIPGSGELQMVTPLRLSTIGRSNREPKSGATLVRLDEAPGRAAITRNIWMGTTLFILLLLGSNGFVLFLIKRRVLCPLDFINRTLAQHSAGDLGARARIVTQDEIGAVADAMNKVFDRRDELEADAIKRASALAEANRLLRESEERFRIAAESTTDIIYDWNVSTGELVWQREIGTALGYEPGEFRATLKAWRNAIHPEDLDRICQVVYQHMENGEPFDVEYRVISKDGSHQFWRDRGRTLSDGPEKESRRVVGVVTNVTAERLAAQQLYVAKEAAENASRAKDDFLAALSHELRTPLSPVLMLASEMERSPEIPIELREGFALIRHNVELEARLIDDLLDLTRITRGKFHIEHRPVDLNDILERAIGTVHAMIVSKELTLRMELAAPDHQIDGDPVRLQQVFWNVLKNAAKFTPPHGAILIRSQGGDNGTIHISITDTGLGIVPEDLERIFNAFEQIHDPATHRFGGLGLGLAISRKLVEVHGGKIWAESDGPGNGTSFHIVLPLLFTQSAEHTREIAPPSVTSRQPVIPLRILLVEDHEETRMIMERLLKRRGHEVFTAGDIATAREFGEQYDLDIVISDIGLPDGSGYDLMSELHRARPHLLGVALSGFGMEQDIQRSREVGFFAHLTKPVDMQVLDRTIADAQNHEAA